MARNAAGLKTALEQHSGAARGVLAATCNVPGSDEELNQSLEKAGRVADFLELGELMCLDALQREESCGGHFREEYQTPDGEALRDDEQFAYVAAWEYQRRRTSRPMLHKEPLDVRERAAGAAELQMRRTLHESHAARLATDERRRAGARSSRYRGARHQPGHVVPRDARRRQRAADRQGEEPIAFDHDCREGICGIVRHDDQRRRARPDARHRRPASSTCAASRTATTIYDRAVARAAFPVIEDLVVDRGAFDRIIAAGRLRQRAHRAARPTANAILIPKRHAGRGDGRRGVHRLRRVRRRLPERLGVAVHRGEDLAPRLAAAGPAGALRRAPAMVAQMDDEGFGHCTLFGECQEACPKEISIDTIARMNRDFLRAALVEGCNGAESDSSGSASSWCSASGPP